jgi:hypothetical protein
LVVAIALLGAVNGQPAQAATCADYSNQAAAQHARDTRDADGDRIYCESLPCPCAKPGDAGSGGDPQPDPPAGSSPRGCVRPNAVQNISFSKTKYPNIRRHFLDALRKGWPRTLVLNRSGADARRDRLLAPYPTRPGQDRDEYSAGGWARERFGARAREQPDRLARRRALRALSRESLARFDHGDQAAALLQRDALSLRLLLVACQERPSGRDQAGHGRPLLDLWRWYQMWDRPPRGERIRP